MICLAEGDPAGALGAVRDVLDGTAPVIGYVTVVEAHLLAGLAHRELCDQRAANQAAERALALAEADRLVLPFAMTDSQGTTGGAAAAPHRARCAPRRHPRRACTARHPGASPELYLGAAGRASSARASCRVLRYLPTNLSRPEIAGELSVSLNTVNTHVRRIYAKLRADDRSAAVHRARKLRLLAADRAR